MAANTQVKPHFKAIYLTATGEVTIHEIKSSYTPQGAQTLVKVDYSGINSGDLRHYYMGMHSFVMGYDYTGVVEAAGPASPFKSGDPVLGMTFPGHARDQHRGAHQAYILADPYLTFLRPASMSPLSAVGLTSPVQTAADAVFNLLGFGLPQAGVEGDDATGKALVVWGGASSLGWATVQLTRVAGFGTILTTASAKNYSALRDAGAIHVFDYHDHDVVDQIKKTCKELGVRLELAIDAVAVGLGIFEPLASEEKAKIEAGFSRGTHAMTKRVLSDGVVELGKTRLASALPVAKDPDFEFALFSRRWPGEEEKHPGWWQRQERIVKWFIQNHEKVWKPMPVEVVDSSEEAVRAVKRVFEGKTSFVKLAMKHPWPEARIFTCTHSRCLIT